MILTCSTWFLGNLHTFKRNQLMVFEMWRLSHKNFPPESHCKENKGVDITWCFLEWEGRRNLLFGLLKWPMREGILNFLIKNDGVMHPESNQWCSYLCFQTLSKKGSWSRSQLTINGRCGFPIYDPEFFPPVQAAVTFGKFPTVVSKVVAWLIFDVSFLALKSELYWPIVLIHVCSMPLSVAPFSSQHFMNFYQGR